MMANCQNYNTLLPKTIDFLDKVCYTEYRVKD